MAQSSRIRVKRSAVPGKIPTTNDLELAEIAINTHDGQMFIKRDRSGNQSVVPLGAIDATDRVFFVAKTGLDTNDGRTIGQAFNTLDKAITAVEQDRQQFLSSNPSEKYRATIYLKTGEYTVSNPLKLPRNTTIVGDNLRSVSISPANPTDDIFYLTNGCYLTGFTFRDFEALTAAAIGQQLGLEDTGPGVTGNELDALDDQAFAAKADEASVFARVSPAHKLRLVEALQANGEIVAMTGDGVNDAPALKRADVGVAMGQQGTDAAREASEVVLADDNFATIAAAIREGRVIYDNIVKSILFMLPTNAAQSLILVTAVFVGLTLPITPPQILWVNMITAVTLALALAFEPAEEGVMSRNPRATDAPLIPKGLGSRLILVALAILTGAMGVFLWERAAGVDIAQARTLAVNTLVLAQVWYLFSARRLHQSSLNVSGLFGNRYVPMAGGVIILAQLAFTYLPPMQFLFDTRALGMREWLVALCVSLPVVAVAEGHKWWQRKRLPAPESNAEQP